MNLFIILCHAGHSLECTQWNSVNTAHCGPASQHPCYRAQLLRDRFNIIVSLSQKLQETFYRMKLNIYNRKIIGACRKLIHKPMIHSVWELCSSSV